MPTDVVERSVYVDAPRPAVWKALVEPAVLSHWMGVPVSVTWEPGSTIEFGAPYPSHGTVLLVEPPSLVRYDQWSRITRLPDRPENRSIVTIRLESESDGTRVSVRYECPPAKASAEHAGFYWLVALDVLRRTVEGRP
jgi:uncharacterized protein YndB with AHSA1/START domain